MRKLLLPFLLLMPLSAAHAEPQTLTPVEPPVAAPDFRLEDMDGNRYALSDLQGEVVIVNFWATWCPPCREEMPSMQRAWEALEPQGVTMLAINVGEDPDTVFRFTADYPVEFPILFDRDSAVIGDWKVMGLPATYVVDPNGHITYRAIGGREWDDPALLAPVLELRD